MSIISTELLMLRSGVITDTDVNGGRMDNNSVVTSNVQNNVWPSVFKAEREAGSTKYRKTFWKVANDDDDTLFNPQCWLDAPTQADDWVMFFVGTQINTQADITGSEDCYGCGALHTNVSAAAGSVIVTLEDASLLPAGADELFRDGDTIRITNKDTPSSGAGTEEIHVISGTPSISGLDITITLVGTLAYAYNTDDNTYGTRIMSVYEPADVVGSYSDFVVTTAGDGDYNDSSYPVIPDSLGTIEQIVTLTFTDSTNFTAASNVSGVTLSSGNTTTEYAPSNPDLTKPYFTLEYEGFSGTYANGDTVVFATQPASVPLWGKRVVPAAASSLTGNRATMVFTGEAV